MPWKPVRGRFAFGRAVDQDVLLLGGQVFEGTLEVDLVAVGGEVDELEQILRGGAGAEAAVEQGLGPVGDDLGGVEVVERAEAVALRAGAEGGVEVKLRGSSLGTSRPQSGQAMEEEKSCSSASAAGEDDQHEAVGHLEGLGDSGFEALFDGGLAGDCRGQLRSLPGSLSARDRGTRCRRGLEEDAVDDGFDGVVLAAVERSGSERSRISPSTRARKPCWSS